MIQNLIDIAAGLVVLVLAGVLTAVGCGAWVCWRERRRGG